MQSRLPSIVALALTVVVRPASAQSARTATYITDEEIKKVAAVPGIDHTIRVVDIGNEHLAVGIIHRGPSAAGAGATAQGRDAGRGAVAPAESCGESAAGQGGVPGAIAHDSQTESYVIVSGGGTLVTGGHIVNGSRFSADSDVTRILNGPSCSGVMVGADIIRRVVKTGDVIIIPAGVPHVWVDIADHVDYLSIRPSDHVLEAGYVNPAIKQ